MEREVGLCHQLGGYTRGCAGPKVQTLYSEPLARAQADLLCRPLEKEAVDPGRLAFWGPHEENWGARADAFALGEFSSRVSRVCGGVLGLQVKVDANSLGKRVQ